MTQERAGQPSSPPLGDTAAIIVAAGSFTRMGGIPKQLVPLAGRPVIAHTVAAFEKANAIREIVLVARPEEQEALRSICRENGFAKVKAIPPGGRTRQESVAAGLACLSEEAAYYAIHDGARPLVTPEMIDGAIRAARRYRAAAAAVRVKDTVKIADADGFVESTPDRRRLWSVQTPQVFEASLYRQAMREAAEKGLDFTDDCQLLERMGVRVFLYETDYTNIKITTPEDLPIAERLLQSRKPDGV